MGTLRASIAECIVGVFGFDENNELIKSILFPKNAEKIAERIERSQRGGIVKELEKLISDLKALGYESFVFESDLLAKTVHEKMDVDVEVERPSLSAQKLRRNFERMVVEAGYTKGFEGVRRLMYDVSMFLATTKVKLAGEEKDLLVIQAVSALDEVDKIFNIISGRVREWYGLHFPELSRLVDKNELYLKLVVGLGERGNFTAERIRDEGLPLYEAKKLVEAAKSSMGIDISEADISGIRALSKKALSLYESRRGIRQYIGETMDEVAPNVKALAGPTLGARLIAAVGGLRNLAKKPSSTIQVLGAEKALFRSIRTKANPPKHGIIFQHPEVHGSSRRERGKIARVLAGKLAIAARLDAYSGRNIGDKLRADFNKRIKGIREARNHCNGDRRKLKENKSFVSAS